MRKRVCVLIAALLLLSSCLSGCYHTEYKGEYPELYTVAVYNFLGRAGCWSNGELVKDSEVEVLGTDSYGRVIFFYHEGTVDWGSGYGILQKTQDGYVYYYEDDCVLPFYDGWSGSGKILHENWFTEEELDAFKVRNDWDQPLNEEKCTKKAIVTKAPEGKIELTEDEWDALMTNYWKATIASDCSNIYTATYFLTEDVYGRELYWMYSSYVDSADNRHEYHFAVILNPDGTSNGTSAILLLDYTWEETFVIDYREDLKEFKQQNGWNTEYIGS